MDVTTEYQVLTAVLRTRPDGYPAAEPRWAAQVDEGTSILRR